MPARPAKACPHPDCPELDCETHRRRYQHLYRGRWPAASRAFLRANPRCIDCGGRATVTDHETPHRGDVRLFWQQTNWRPRCKRCHDRKTAARDGGFGNPSSHMTRTSPEPGAPRAEQPVERRRARGPVAPLHGNAVRVRGVARYRLAVPGRTT